MPLCRKMPPQEHARQRLSSDSGVSEWRKLWWWEQVPFLANKVACMKRCAAASQPATWGLGANLVMW